MVVLPSDRRFEVADTGRTFWFGGPVNDPRSGFGQAFVELQFFPDTWSEGFNFLGFRLQWRRKRGTAKWHVYTFIDKRPIWSLKAKIRALTRRTSQLDLGYVLTRLNQVMHSWAGYFRHAVAKYTLGAEASLFYRIRGWCGFRAYPAVGGRAGSL